MPTVTPPITLNRAASARVTPPALGGNIVGLVLQNLTTYDLLVTIGADSYYQAPLTAQIYAIGTSGVDVLVTSQPDASDTTVSGTVTAMWYQSGEQPLGTYPVALSSPAAIAVLAAQQVAAAINAAGVPNVGQYTYLGRFTFGVGPANGIGFDTHTYASMCFVSPNSDTAAALVTITDTGAVGSAPLINSLSQPADPSGVGTILGPSYMNIDAGSIKLINSAPRVGSVTLDVYASNRTLPAMILPKQYTGIDIQSTGNIAMVAATNYNMTTSALPFAGQTQLISGGRAWVDFEVTGTVVKGSFRLVNYDGIINIADTTEGHPLGTGQAWFKEVIFPKSGSYLQFNCSVAGTATALARIVYQGN